MQRIFPFLSATMFGLVSFLGMALLIFSLSEIISSFSSTGFQLTLSILFPVIYGGLGAMFLHHTIAMSRDPKYLEWAQFRNLITTFLITKKAEIGITSLLALAIFILPDGIQLNPTISFLLNLPLLLVNSILYPFATFIEIDMKIAILAQGLKMFVPVVVELWYLYIISSIIMFIFRSITGTAGKSRMLG